MSEEPNWILIDPVNNETAEVCAHCAMRLVAAQAAMIPEWVSENLIYEGVRMAILAPGHTIENTQAVH